MGSTNMLPSVDTSRSSRAYCPACKQAETWAYYHRLEEDTRREQGNAAVVQDLRQTSAERFAAMLTSVASATHSAQELLQETSLQLSDFLLRKDAQREALWVGYQRSLTRASPTRWVSAFCSLWGTKGPGGRLHDLEIVVGPLSHRARGLPPAQHRVFSSA